MNPSNKVHSNKRCVLGLVTLLLTLVALAPSTALASGVWSAPTNVVGGGSLTSVSCSSATFCVTLGDVGFYVHNALTYNGTSWSAPTNVGGSRFVLTSVSCSSPTFCAAIGANGPGVSDALTYNGRSWSAPTDINTGGGSYNYLTLISCSSATFCVAVGDIKADVGGYLTGDTEYARTYNGTLWSAPTDINSTSNDSGGPTSVSCSSPTFCVAVLVDGYALTYNGMSWTAPTHIDANPGTCGMSCMVVGLDSVSCPSATFCVAVDSNGNALTYNGTSWSAPTNIDASGKLDSVSCSSATFCVAVDENGNALTYNGTSWSAPTHIGGGLTSVSCPSATFCVAVGSSADHAHAISLTYTTAAAGEASASVKIEKFKVTASSLVVTIKTSRAGTVTITGPGLKKTSRTVAAGTPVMTVALTKAGKAERAGRKKIKLSVSLKMSIKTVSRSVEIKL